MPRLSAHDVPHTSQTDHRIRRSHTESLPEELHPAMISDWELFDHAEERLPRWEVDRVRGLNLLQMAQRNSPMAAVYLREAEPLLRLSLRAAPDDVRALEALGLTLMGQEREGEARECFDQVLEIRPRHERALDLLAEICLRAGNFDTGIMYSESLLAVNPWIARYYARQSDMLRRADQMVQALECAEKSLRLDPWQTQIRSWLVEAYRMSGDIAASQQHAEILRRMRGG
jgi:tetratricopeptide (TPR) repeat protein